MRIIWVFLIFTLLIATTIGQDSNESEESPTPKKVLRKYRVRRVQGNSGETTSTTSTTSSSSSEVVVAPVKPNQRVRRVRIKQQKQSQPIVIEATPQNLLSTRYGTSTPASAAVKNVAPQQVFYDEQQVVDPVRVVPNYRTAIPSSTRNALLANVNLRDRDHEDNKRPVVGTTRNYSHINEDGSFTFGYEAEDGSFKEETRGTDCVVRGKYGYVDPTGVRREFSYVSGNPCDPNDPNKGETLEDDEDEESAVPPSRGGVIRQRIPIERKPTTLINSNVQQALEQTVEERVQEDQVYRPVLRRLRPQAQPQTQTQQPDFLPPTTFRPRVRISQSRPENNQVPEAVIRTFPSFRQPLNPRPLVEPNQDLSADRGPRTFNFQQELQDIVQQPDTTQQRPQIQYRQIPYQQFQQQAYRPPIHTFPQRQHFGSQATSIFPQQQQLTQAEPTQQQQQEQKIEEKEQQQPGNYARYRTELVYDPQSGQYTNIVVQESPKTNEEFTLTQRLRAFADPQRPDQLRFQPYEQPQLQYFPQQFNGLGQGFHYQQQQPIQYSAQSPQAAAATQTINQLHPEAQQVANSAASGQIDAFLRTLNYAG